jgi:hypothetical protein
LIKTFPTGKVVCPSKQRNHNIYKDDFLKSRLVRCSVLKSRLVGKFCSSLPVSDCRCSPVVSNQSHTETLKLGRSLLLRSDDADFLNERILLDLL